MMISFGVSAGRVVDAISFRDRKSILTTDTHTLDIAEILDLLPHRYPFLLVDRVLEFEEHKYLRAVKNVSVNEPFFQGHFLANRFSQAY